MENKIVKFNVGGTVYATSVKTIRRIANSYLDNLIRNPQSQHDEHGNYFIDRDSKMFRYILDFHRYGKASLPKHMNEFGRLREEALFYGLNEMVQEIDKLCRKGISAITIGYRGTFSMSKDGSTDLRFRKLARILVAGQTAECRRIFGDCLNDTRDPDTGSSYSSRFFLKHTILEQAFDLLLNDGYKLICSCASGTSGAGPEIKFGQDEEEARWQHYNEFIFIKQH